MLIGTDGILAPGQSFMVTMMVDVDPAAYAMIDPAPTNQAVATGTPVDMNGNPINDPTNPVDTPLDPVTDDSDSGDDPNTTNPAGEGDTGGSDDPTPITLPLAVNAGKTLVSIVPATTPGNAIATYEFILRNIGGVEATNLSIVDDLADEFGSGFVGVTTAPSLSMSVSEAGSTDPTINGSYNGLASNNDLLLGTDGALVPGDSVIVSVSVELDADMLPMPAENQATVSAEDNEGNVATDDSDDESDLNEDGDPDNETGGEDDASVLPPFPSIGVAKSVNDVSNSPTSPDHYLVTYRHIVQNTGNTQLRDIILLDDVVTAFQGGYVTTTNIEVLPGEPSAQSAPTAAPSGTVMDGVNNALAANTGILNPGEQIIVDITVEVNVSAITGVQPLLNMSTVEGRPTDDGGTTLNNPLNMDMPFMAGDVVDTSDSGSDPDGSNPGAPNDGGGTDVYSDPTPLSLPGQIAVVKTISGTAPAASGTFGNYDVTMDFLVDNIGSVALTNLSLVDEIADQFGAAFVGVTTAPAILSPPANAASVAPTTNGGYNGDLDSEMLGLDGSLEPGDSLTVRLVIEVDASMAGPSGLENQATASGADSFGNDITDISDDNTSSTDNPDGSTDNPNGAGDDGTGGTNNPSQLLIPDVDATKAVTNVSAASSGIQGNVDITYQVIVQNTGTTPLENIDVMDDVATQLAASYVGVTQEPVIVSSSATTDPGTGALPIVLDGTGTLLPGEQVIVEFIVELDASEIDANEANQASVTSTPTDGMGNPIPDPNNPGMDLMDVMDDSDSGNDPTGTNPNGEGDTGTPDDVTPLPLIPAIGVAKAVTDAVPAASGTAGNFDVTYTMVIENIGSADITNLSLEDDLLSQMGGAFVGVTTAPAIDGASTAAVTGGIDAGFTGSGVSKEMLDLTGIVESGETVVVTVTVEIDPDSPSAILNSDGVIGNTATVSGDPIDENGDPLVDSNGDPVGPISDDSDNGADPDGNNGEGGFDDPTPLELPSMGVAKAVTEVTEAASGMEGNFDVTIEYVVVNDGNTKLKDLSLIDEISAQYGAAYVGITSTPIITMNGATAGPLENGAYAGSGDLLVPMATDDLQPGEMWMIPITGQILQVIMAME